MNEHTYLEISPSAAKRVSELMAASDIGLRVYVEGGGCSGFQYGFQLEKEKQDDDIVLEGERCHTAG